MKIFLIILVIYGAISLLTIGIEKRLDDISIELNRIANYLNNIKRSDK